MTETSPILLRIRQLGMFILVIVKKVMVTPALCEQMLFSGLKVATTVGMPMH